MPGSLKGLFKVFLQTLIISMMIGNQHKIKNIDPWLYCSVAPLRLEEYFYTLYCFLEFFFFFLSSSFFGII